MTRRATKRRARLPAGAWRRFLTALAALVVVLVGVPALLIVCSRVGLESSHPFPAIGSTDEIKAFFERDLTPTEIAPIAMRVLLIVGWVLWLGYGAVRSRVDLRGPRQRAAIVGAAVRSCSPASVGGLPPGSRPSPRSRRTSCRRRRWPRHVRSRSARSPPSSRSAVESPVPPGFGRVQRGESIETFAQRLLGDAGRWPEIWELNKDQDVGPDGEAWTAPWKLGAGWDLRLPADAVPVVGADDSATASAVRCAVDARRLGVVAPREPDGRRRVRGRRGRLVLGDRRALPARAVRPRRTSGSSPRR